MPYLRLFSPALSTELKRKLAYQLTDAAIRGLGYTEETRQRTTVHFVPIEADDIAVAGELISDGGSPDYTLEITGRELTKDAKRAAVKELLPVIMQNFGLRKEQRWKVNIKFNSYSLSDFSVGGTFLDELEKKSAFRLHASSAIGMALEEKAG